MNEWTNEWRIKSMRMTHVVGCLRRVHLRYTGYTIQPSWVHATALFKPCSATFVFTEDFLSQMSDLLLMLTKAKRIQDFGNKLFVLPKLTNIITETAESIAESECNRNADLITEMASFITDATKWSYRRGNNTLADQKRYFCTRWVFLHQIVFATVGL